MTELSLAAPAHPSVLMYLQRCPPHLPDGVEGQRRENNWNNPLDLLNSLFNIHLEVMDNLVTHLTMHCAFPHTTSHDSSSQGQKGHSYILPLSTHWCLLSRGSKSNIELYV